LLKKAKELGLKLSYPEFYTNNPKNKKTYGVVIAAHKKTTITSMILHVITTYDWSGLLAHTGRFLYNGSSTERMILLF
jgi:UDP-N-acetylmuramate-alanine ligase